MGKEVIDTCFDEESDCVIISSASDNLEPHDDHASNHSELSGSDEATRLTPDSHATTVESKEHDAEEGNIEFPLEGSVTGNGSCLQEQEMPSLKNINLDGDILEKQKVNSVLQKPSSNKFLDHSVKVASKSTSTATVRSSCTVPQPFALATDKRASGANRNVVSVAGEGNKHASVNSWQSENMLKRTPANSGLTLRKPLQPDNTKLTDEEDSCSVASSTAASVKTLKGRSTVASGPTFRCSQRAEKRKEFYSKLEEKHQALEAEKNQYEARTKEEREAALKQLRKSLTFKAKPMPSFYNEGPPPKVELKKPPPTRAKSPKLGRRKSCGDTTNPSEGENNGSGACVRANRHSLGTYKVSNKLQSTVKNGNSICKDKEGPKSAREGSNKSLPHKVTEQRTADITVQS